MPSRRAGRRRAHLLSTPFLRSADAAAPHCTLDGRVLLRLDSRGATQMRGARSWLWLQISYLTSCAALDPWSPGVVTVPLAPIARAALAREPIAARTNQDLPAVAAEGGCPAGNAQGRTGQPRPAALGNEPLIE